MADIVHVAPTKLDDTGLGVTDTVNLVFDEGVDEVIVLEVANSGTGVCRLVVTNTDSSNLITDMRVEEGETKRANLQRLPQRISFYVERFNGAPVVTVTERTNAGAVLPSQSQAEPDDLNTYLGRAIGETVPPWTSTVTVSPADSVFDAIEALDVQSAAVGIARQNYIVVNELSDFPTPVGGVITLASGVIYEINGTVDIGTNRIDASAVLCLRGLCPEQDRLLCNNASALITTTGSLDMGFLTLINSGGPVLDASATTANTFITRSLRIRNSVSVGTIQGYGVIALRRLVVTGCSDGFTIDGTNGFVVFGPLLSTSNLGTFTFLTIPNTAAVSSVLMSGMSIDSAAGQTALNIDAAALISERGIVVDSSFTGAGTALTGITKSQLGWQFRGNSGILDSRNIGEIVISGNALETTINVVDQFESINATFSDGLLERFTRAGDTLTYQGDNDVEVQIIANLNVIGVGTGDKTAVARLLLNGSPVGITGLGFVDNVRNQNLIPLASLTISNGDTVSIEITNQTNTNNLIVEDMLLSVTER